jgi:hypothetical protein
MKGAPGGRILHSAGQRASYKWAFGINQQWGPAIIIILCLYLVAMWIVFSKFKLVRWGWFSGTVSVLVGLLILATFLAFFNYLTPSGKVTVAGTVWP